ncbi:MAG: hypothetical protein U1F76_05040 [Candidatus Competibacteraceae bacterium]
MSLFTSVTWQEFLAAGGTISGYPQSRQEIAKQVQAEDILLCYLTNAMRWVGALAVIGPSQDTRPIWREAEFPVRLEVNPLVTLEPEQGLLMDDLESKVTFYTGPKDAGKFKKLLRSSLSRFPTPEDGEIILKLLQEAAQNPVIRPLEPVEPPRKPLFRVELKVGKKTVEERVSIPEAVETIPPDEAGGSARQAEILFQLLTLGAEMGLDTWLARHERTRTWNGRALGKLPSLLEELPPQYNEATRRAIELIDVVWLKGNEIVTAFEVETTASLQAGLLRLSDLLVLQPDPDIKLYLVSPDERRHRAEQEIRRPSFHLRQRPLGSACGFLPFSRLLEKIKGIRKLGIAASLNPQFLEGIAEYFTRPDPED